MPRGRTDSPYNLSQRREKAFDLFMKGWTDVNVAERLQVTAETVARYRKEYMDTIELQARSNPSMLRQVLENTIVALEENATVRKSLWEEYESGKEPLECGHCGALLDVPGPGATTRNQILKSILAAQDQRARLFGLFGVKQEYFVMVQNIQHVQEKLLDFLRTRLPADLRREVEALLTSSEMTPYTGAANEEPIEAELVEITSGTDS